MTRGARLAGVLLLLCGLVACGSGGDDQGDGAAATGAAADADDGLVIYTARATEITDELIPLFEEAHPEYAGTVEIINLGAQEVLERVRAESANPQADVWWGGTQQAFDLAAEEGLLATVDDVPALEEIPEEYRDPEGRWFGEILLPEVIMYNTEAVPAEEAPADWDDLLDPKWEGQIQIRDVAPSGTMRSIFTAMILNAGGTAENPEPGYEWLQQLDANTVAYAANPSELYLRLARQEGTVSLWNLQDVLIQAEQQGLPFGFVIPESGAPVLTDGVAVVEGAVDPNAARTFLEFLYSDEVRARLTEDFFQIPTVELAEEPQWLADLDLRILEVDWAVAGANEEEWIAHWEQNIRGG